MKRAGPQQAADAEPEQRVAGLRSRDCPQLLQRRRGVARIRFREQARIESRAMRKSREIEAVLLQRLP